MLRKMLIWLSILPDPRPVQVSPEHQASIDRLDEMYGDIGRLAPEVGFAKWRFDRRP